MAKKQLGEAGNGPISDRFLLERRQFLVLSSVALVGFATSDLAADTLRPSADAGLPQSLSVAFVEGLTAGGVITNVVSGTGIVAAKSMTAGDPSFLSRSARVSVLGLWRAEGRRSEPISVTLKAYYPTLLAAGGDVPYIGWNQINEGSRFRIRPTHFLVPVDDAGLRIEIEAGIPQKRSVLVQGLRQRVSTPPSETVEPRSREAIKAIPTVAALSLGIENNAAKLRPGTYVLALVPAGQPAPNWDRIRYEPLQMKADGGPVSVMGAFSNDPAPFDYVVVNVDFAG